MTPTTAVGFNFALKSTVILLAAFAATFTLRRAPASSRRFLWILAAVSLLALPLLTLLMPQLKIQPPPMTQAISFNPAPAPASVVLFPESPCCPHRSQHRARSRGSPCFG